MGASDDVVFAAGDVLARVGEPIDRVHFLTSGVVGLFATADGASEVGVGLVDRSGIVGLGAAASRPGAALTARSLGPGSARRIEATAFRTHLASCPTLQGALLDQSVRWAAQVARNAACIATHPTSMRLARWLLDVTACLPAGHAHATQEAMAASLGVQRAAVNGAATAFQRDGLIAYSRGDVRILERRGLARIACRCSR